MDLTAPTMRPERIKPSDFNRFRRLIHETWGISLGDTKDALLTSRLGRRMRELGLRSHADYFDLVLADASGVELQCLVDAVSTNVTSFFREPEHFAILGDHLRQVAEEGREIRMWSAACSTGEEPYSMAMVATEAVSGSGCRVRILATDVSSVALRRAAGAVYDVAKIAKLPKQQGLQHFRRTPDGEYELSPLIRRMVAFSPINLSRPPFPMRQSFEVVFCRNVMIYFDPNTRRRLVAEIDRLLTPGGLLMLGHAESLAGIAGGFKAVAPSVYRKAAR